MRTHYTIRVQGIVQGVGFRPFVFRLAQRLAVSGSVWNDTEGVVILAEGEEADLKRFIEEIRNNPPPLASIRALDFAESEITGVEGFTIEKSRISQARFTFLPPDTAVCPECLAELFDASDRRSSYPFITCIHCGPRFSIVSDIPYDRKNTSMDPFHLCPRCSEEYDNPLDRRFHTQPNACPVCGPHLSLCAGDGRIIADSQSVVSEAGRLLRQGGILAIKGVGGYLIACDAVRDAPVLELRRRKGRPFKPFAVMAGSVKKLEEFLFITPEEKKLLLSKERPIVVCREKSPLLSRYIAPSLSYHGVMLPYMPFHYLLFAQNSGMVLVMTSGNIADEPILFREDEAFRDLRGVADYFVVYNREIVAHSDDSVLFVSDEAPCFIRRSRGYVPSPLYSSRTDHHLLATGGDLKNCFGLAKEDVIILSQHLGDMSSASSSELFVRTVEHYRKVYDFSPGVVVSDMHPGYFTNAFADEMEGKGLRRIKVQHHHAHIVSVMEDCGADGRVIGLAFDGTGYGTDGTLWGSEFLIADRDGFERAGHFSYFPLPGGESAIRDVWKIGVSLLHGRFGDDLPLYRDNPQTGIVLEIIRKGINSPPTCSIGRIFDGVSSILGISHRISTEAEAAQLLEEEALSCGGSKSGYEIPFSGGQPIVLQTGELIDFVIAQIKRGLPRGEIARLFHEAIARSSVRVAEMLRDTHGIQRVALSGGAFQNRLLLSLIAGGLRGKGFDILTPSKVPFNDGCIALGQLAVAKEKMKHEQ